MNKKIVAIVLLILLAALAFPFLLHLVGALVGLAFGIAIALGVLLLVGFVLVTVFSGTGILTAGILGLVGVILLALALPILAPLFLVLLPVIIILWLISRR